MAPLSSKKIELDFANFEIYQDYVVSTIKEGVVFDTPHLAAIAQIFNTYFPKEPFISIADRKFDYTINPTCLMNSSITPNLVGIGVICYTKSAKETAQFEKNFYKGNYEVFSSMKSALNWSQKCLKEVKKKQAYKPDSVS